MRQYKELCYLVFKKKLFAFDIDLRSNKINIRMTEFSYNLLEIEVIQLPLIIITLISRRCTPSGGAENTYEDY